MQSNGAKEHTAAAFTKMNGLTGIPKELNTKAFEKLGTKHRYKRSTMQGSDAK